MTRPAITRSAILRFAILSFAIILCGASAASRAAGDDFLPLGNGARWEYTIHRDHTYRPAGAKTDRTFRSGTVVLEHIRARDIDGAVVHELRERREEDPMGPGLPPSRETSTQHWSATSGLRLRAIEPVGGSLVRFDPPLQMLPARPEVGARWRVGTFRIQSIAIPLEGEVVGWTSFDDDSIRCEHCLEVRYTGSASGSIPVATGSATVDGIRYERVAWWEPGVGLVREIVTTDGDIELPDADVAHVHEVTTQRLVRHTAPR